MNQETPTNDDHLEDNIKKLLSSAQPELKMPQASKTRILSILTTQPAKTPSAIRFLRGKAKTIFKSRTTRYAAAAIILLTITLWPTESKNGIAWADVVGAVRETMKGGAYSGMLDLALTVERPRLRP